MTTEFVFCTKCAEKNPATNDVCMNPSCGNPLPKRKIIPTPNQTIDINENAELILLKERENKIKASTVIFILLGLITPLWLITLPLFWYLAYQSYKKPWSF